MYTDSATWRDCLGIQHELYTYSVLYTDRLDCTQTVRITESFGIHFHVRLDRQFFGEKLWHLLSSLHKLCVSNFSLQCVLFSESIFCKYVTITLRNCSSYTPCHTPCHLNHVTCNV